MEKQKVIDIFKTCHENLRKLLDSLTPDQMVNEKVTGVWSIKDILAHLSAWNWEQVKEIDNILHDQPTWYKKYQNKEGQDDFNKKAVDKRRNRHIDQIIKEWDDSYEYLMKRIEKLTDKQWNHKCIRHIKSDGKPVTLQSIFKYEENELSDDGQHADQIKKFFKL